MSEPKFDYAVTLFKQFPNWDEVKGLEYEVRATDRRDAIKRARVLADSAGHIDSLSGKLTFYALKGKQS